MSIKNFFISLSKLFTATCLAIAVIELIATLGVNMIPTLSGMLTEKTLFLEVDHRVNSPAYKDKELATAIFADRKKLPLNDYAPYTVWKNEKLNLQTITTNALGIRKTCFQPEPGSNPNVKAKRIFMLGGGHIFGIGADDCNTIPSFLAKKLGELHKGTTFEITNFGTGGHTSTQSLIKLMIELRNGNIPDYVIFLSGHNDVFVGTYKPGVPGSHMKYHRVATKLNYSGLDLLLRSSNTAKLIESVHERLFKRFAAIPDDVIEERNSATISIYRENIRMLHAFSELYGFNYQAFWQPLPGSSKKPKTPFEAKRYETLGILNEIHADAARKVEALDFSGNKFHSLVDIFDETTMDIFTDADHLGLEANSIVVDAMYDVIKDDLSALH